MENPLRKQIRSIMKDHKKRQMWYRIVTTLAVVVVFVTTYMLILPAITMENKAECGITEHKHDANCYSSHYEKEKELACTTDSLGVHKHTDACYDAEHKLICGYADFVIHEHDASCYDKDGNLVCTIPEHKLHQHTPECYQMQKQLVCTQEESVGHTHTPECYTKQQGALICGKEEHTHGEGCYDAEGNLICTLEEHTHSDECYEWNDILTCTIPESAGHTHSEACYQDVQVLVCEEPAELHTHTAECYKDGVLACGKLELKEHKHSETCFTEKQVLVETLICDRVEHVHTDECYKKSTEETATSEAVTASQNEETSSEDESSETASIEETSSEETSTEEASSEADTDAEESSEETSLEETSLEEASTEETSLEASSEDESEAESETESAEEVESESEIESESESETEESSSVEAESEEEQTSEEASTEENSSEAEEESSELPQLTGIWPQDMIAVASALVGSENKDLVEFCLNYVGVYGVLFNTDLDAWIESLQENDLYGAADEFDPNPGDVAFFDEDGDGSADYAGVVVGATFDEDGVVTEFTVVEKNDQGIVEEHVYSAGEESLMGCCLMPYIADSNYALVIPETTTYTDFKKYVTSMTGKGTEYDKTTGNYKSELKVNFSIPSADVKDANYSYELKYPEGIIVPGKLIGQTFTLEDENNTNAGTFHFVKNEDGTYSARINFDQDYVNNAGTTITGHLWFEGELKKTTVTDEGKIVISGEDKVKLEIPREEIKYPEDENDKYNIDVMKKEASYNKETGKLEYTVYVSSIKGTPDDIDFSDTITVTGMTLGKPQITVTKQTMKKYSWDHEGNPSKSETITVSSAYESNTIKMKLPKLPKGKEGQDHNPYVEYERYEIKYSYDVSSMDVGTLTANNKAHVESKDSKTGEIIRDEDKKDITIENKYEIAKRGDFDSANNQIKWTITLNSKNANIVGGKLTDGMLSMIKSGTDVTITPSNGANIVRGADGKITSIDFEPVSNGKNTNQYTITYYTEAESTWKDQIVRNTATFRPDGGDDVSGTGDVSIKGGEVTKTKDSAVEAPDGKTAEVNWTVSLIIPDGKLPKTTIKDSMSSTHNWQQGNGEGNYLTVKQIKDWGGKYTWKSNDTIVKTGAFTESDFKLTFKTKDGREYSYSKISSMDNSSDLKFTSFNVDVLNDISCDGANKLTFSYKTTADLTQAVTGDKNNYVNRVDVDDKNDDATYHYTYSKGEIIKTDGNGKTDSSSTTTAGELTWKIKVTTDTGDHRTLTVTDKLPQGVTLKEFSVEKQSGDHDKSTYIVKPDGTISEQDGGKFENEFSINGSKYENGQLTLIIQRNNGNTLPKAMSFEIVVKCEVNGAEGMQAGVKSKFTNEASAKLDDVSIGSSSQTQEWTKMDTTVAKKVVDKSGDYDNKTRRVKYSIVLNPDAKDLVKGTDKLTLVDTLDSYNKTYWSDGGIDGVTVQTELIPNTVKLYHAVPDGNGGYIAGDEVTGWAWTYKEEPTSYNQDRINHIITATDIPDSTALIFKYEYLITVDVPDKNHTKVNVNINNTATLSGTSWTDTTGDKSYQWERQAAGGGVTTDKNYILYKVEKGNYGKALSGAVFQLQKYLNGDYQNIDGKTFTTDQEGKITVLWDASLYEKNVLYKLVEVKAPSGYKLPDGEAPSIEFYFSDENDKANVLPSQIPIGAFDLSKASHTSYLENEVSQSYVLPETGGTGTYCYTMGGVLLTAGAAFLIYKKHMQKGGKRIW